MPRSVLLRDTAIDAASDTASSLPRHLLLLLLLGVQRRRRVQRRRLLLRRRQVLQVDRTHHRPGGAATKARRQVRLGRRARRKAAVPRSQTLPQTLAQHAQPQAEAGLPVVAAEGRHEQRRCGFQPPPFGSWIVPLTSCDATATWWVTCALHR